VSSVTEPYMHGMHTKRKRVATLLQRTLQPKSRASRHWKYSTVTRDNSVTKKRDSVTDG